MPHAIVRPAAIGKKASGNFDFEGHFAITMLSMGIEVPDDTDIPAFRSWVDRLLRFLRLA
jgi:hypothetical protein